MHAGRFVFSQVMDFLPMYEFHKCVKRYRGDYRARFSGLDPRLSMAFAQLTHQASPKARAGHQSLSNPTFQSLWPQGRSCLT